MSNDLAEASDLENTELSETEPGLNDQHTQSSGAQFEVAKAEQFQELSSDDDLANNIGARVDADNEPEEDDYNGGASVDETSNDNVEDTLNSTDDSDLEFVEEKAVDREVRQVSIIDIDSEEDIENLESEEEPVPSPSSHLVESNAESKANDIAIESGIGDIEEELEEDSNDDRNDTSEQDDNIEHEAVSEDVGDDEGEIGENQKDRYDFPIVVKFLSMEYLLIPFPNGSSTGTQEMEALFDSNKHLGWTLRDFFNLLKTSEALSSGFSGGRSELVLTFIELSLSINEDHEWSANHSIDEILVIFDELKHNSSGDDQMPGKLTILVTEKRSFVKEYDLVKNLVEEGLGFAELRMEMGEGGFAGIESPHDIERSRKKLKLHPDAP